MRVNYYNDFTDEVYKNYQKYNWIGSNGFCFDESGKVAIVWEHEKNYWTLAGGGKENNETPVETFIREVKEETQCDIVENSIHFFHTILVEKIDEFGNIIDDKYKKIGFRFICKLKNIQEFIPRKKTGEFVSEIDEREFVSLEDLPKYITWLVDSESGRESFEVLKKILVEKF